jgi:hypothetical protein
LSYGKPFTESRLVPPCQGITKPFGEPRLRYLNCLQIKHFRLSRRDSWSNGKIESKKGEDETKRSYEAELAKTALSGSLLLTYIKAIKLGFLWQANSRKYMMPT